MPRRNKEGEFWQNNFKRACLFCFRFPLSLHIVSCLCGVSRINGGGKIACMSIDAIAPIKFAPYFKTVLWGGEKIASYKGMATDLHNIGESWELSCLDGKETVAVGGAFDGLTLRQVICRLKERLVGQHVYDKFGCDFPLLIKIIDAKSNLSLQVHPDDRVAKMFHSNGSGKTEMWYVVKADEGAKIYSGLREKITPEEYERRVSDNTIMDVVAYHDSHDGDLFFLPAGRIHSIGAGNLLVEVQQASDITYRVYDFGRLDSDGKPRELHTEMAKMAINYSVEDNYKIDYDRSRHGEVDLIACEYFHVRRVISDEVFHVACGGDSFMVMICIGGRAKLRCDNATSVELRQGETALVPAEVSALDIIGNATFLTVTA